MFPRTPNPANYFFSQPSGHLTHYSPHRASEFFVPIIAGLLNSEERLTHYPNEQCAEDGSEWLIAVTLTVTE